MVLSIIFLEDKHQILLHLSILYEYQQFFQHRMTINLWPPYWPIKGFWLFASQFIAIKIENLWLSDSALDFLFSYLHQRKQCIKVENVCSNFKYMYKGVPHWSILGPVLFKIFINDIFYAVNNSTNYNYAVCNNITIRMWLY